MKSKVHSTQHILKDLDNCIKRKKSFSVMRHGDTGYEIMHSYLAKNKKNILPGINFGASKKFSASNKICNQLGIPVGKRQLVARKIARFTSNANYIDSPLAFSYLKRNYIYSLNSIEWQRIINNLKIKNNSFCNPLLNCFCIIEGEYNLFDVMKKRRIFCITNNTKILPKIQNISKATKIDFIQIPGRNAKNAHYPNYFHKINKIIQEKSTYYDFFLVGAGYLGRYYIGMIKQYGGRAFDFGAAFKLWKSGNSMRKKIKPFIRMNNKTFLCKRKIKTGSGVW